MFIPPQGVYRSGSATEPALLEPGQIHWVNLIYLRCLQAASPLVFLILCKAVNLLMKLRNTVCLMVNVGGTPLIRPCSNISEGDRGPCVGTQQQQQQQKKRAPFQFSPCFRRLCMCLHIMDVQRSSPQRRANGL